MMRLDVLLGLLAWLVALVPITSVVLHNLVRSINDLSFETGLWILPAIWTALVIVMVALRRRPLRKLWWVWPSFLFAFFYWVVIIFTFTIWSYGSFAP
jgi:hypothetical protein